MYSIQNNAYTQGSEFLAAVQEAITVIHGDRGYILSFTGSTTTFDDPENVEIRERMLGSLQFLDGGENECVQPDMERINIYVLIDSKHMTC